MTTPLFSSLPPDADTPSEPLSLKVEVHLLRTGQARLVDEVRELRRDFRTGFNRAMVRSTVGIGGAVMLAEPLAALLRELVQVLRALAGLQ